MKRSCLTFFGMIFLSVLLFSCAMTMEERKEKAKISRQLGEAYLVEEKYAAAFKELTKALELLPDDPTLHHDFGLFYFKRKKYELAKKEYLKVLELQHDYSSARNNLGATYLALKEYDNAIQCLKQLLDNYIYATPHYPNFLIGQAYYYKGDYESALKYFKAAVDLSPKYSVAYHWQGKTLLKMGKPAEAVDALNTAIHQNQVYGAFYFDLGQAYEQLKNRPEAIEAYKKAIAIEADSPTARDAAKAIDNLERY